jgi:hypothetical protein
VKLLTVTYELRGDQTVKRGSISKNVEGNYSLERLKRGLETAIDFEQSVTKIIDRFNQR